MDHVALSVFLGLSSCILRQTAMAGKKEGGSWNNVRLSSFWGHREFLERLDRRFRSRSVLGLPRFLRAMREIEMHLKLERSLFSLCLWVTKRNKLPSAMPQRDPSNFSRSASPRTSVEIGMYRVTQQILVGLTLIVPLILPNCSAKAEVGKQWNSQNQCQPRSETCWVTL